MSCFIVPMTQAIATTAYRKLNAKKIEATGATALMRHVPALEKMLWGGTVMLVVDHIINGEVTWRYPFFTRDADRRSAHVASSYCRMGSIRFRQRKKKPNNQTITQTKNQHYVFPSLWG